MNALSLTLFALLTQAAPAGKAAAPLTFRFGTVEGPRADAQVDLGHLSAESCDRDTRCHSHAIIQARRITVQLVGVKSGPRFARLSAQLDTADAQHRIKINGLPLSAAPQLIDANAPIGVTLTFTLEIEIPSSEPEGTLLSAITWTAETD